MSNKYHDPILETLSRYKYGKIHESVSKNVKNSLDRFYKEQKTPSGVKKMINNILNYIYLKSNEFGDNNFTGGKFDYTKGDIEDRGGPESGPLPEMYPSIYEVSYQIKFTDPRIDIKSFYDTLAKGIKSDMKSNFQEYERDIFSTIVCIDTKFSEGLGYAMSIEPRSSEILVTVYNQVSPYVSEGGVVKPVKVVKYFKGKNPWDNFEFKFTPFINDDKEKCMQIFITNKYWNSQDYAFVKLPDLEEVYSYSTKAASKVRNAISKAGYTSKDFEEIMLILNESTDESATGVLGMEIGLPIDKENCEGTDVSGVSTPSGTINPKSESEEVIACPKCNSLNVNVVLGTRFKCSDCGCEWELSEGEEDVINSDKDGMLDNSEDEKPKYSKDLQSNVNIYIDPRQGLHESKTITSSTKLKGDLEDAVCSVGDLEYISKDNFEINVPKSNTKEVLDGIEKFLKKMYPTERANNKLFISGGDDVHYLEVFIKKKVGNNDTYIVSYNLPI